MTFPYAPTPEQVDDIEWARSWKQDRVSFWGHVDSTPGAASPRCNCDHPTRTCRLWACERNDDRCLAGNSHGERCNKAAVKAGPFCPFHLDRAWVWMLAVADEQMTTRLAASRLKAEMAELCVALEVEQAWDAKLAAERLTERVYFYVADTAVKIGRSINPGKRVRTLGDTKAPHGVDVRAGNLIGTIPGGARVENLLHRKFAYCRLVGEWFDYPEIRGEIAAILHAGAIEAGEVA